MIELMIALVLLALMSAVLFGSLNLAGRSSDAGAAKADASSGMRLAGDYLRTPLAAQHPQRNAQCPGLSVAVRRRS
jgi:type II secretory pathway component PulJ